ncbi:MAG: thioredoxin domain-containing protein [Deltaproteobacteria bacterium]|nr:thioredoxin domain-containing protein [Deltaproteobacteria bacterium]
MRASIWMVILLWSSNVLAGSIPWSRVPGGKNLSSADRKKAAVLLQSVDCYFGCSDKVAACLRRQPSCHTARFLAGMIVRMVRQGRSLDVIRRQAMLRAKSMHPFRARKIDLHASMCTADPRKAKVVVVGVSDFQCPFCTVVLPRLKGLMAQYGRRVAFCFKQFPTQMHGANSVMSARASVAAALQGRFWAMFDILYKHRQDQKPSQVERYATAIGLDMARFRRDRDSRATRRLVALDKRQGLRYGVKGTPTLFIDGKHYYGRKDGEEIRSRIDEELVLVAGGN